MRVTGVRSAWPAGAGKERHPRWHLAISSTTGRKCLAAQRGAIFGFELAHADLLDPLETLRHDFHVRLHDGFTELAKLLHVLLVNHVAELLLGDAEFAQQWRDREECAQESVPLHAKLKVGAIGRHARSRNPAR